MRFYIIPIIILLIFVVGTDIYIWRCFKKQNRYIYGISSLLCWIAFALAFTWPLVDNKGFMIPVMWILFTLVSIYVVKWCYIILHLIGKLLKIKRFNSGLYIGAPLGMLLAISLWWGVIVTRFTIDVNKYNVESSNIPPAFNNFTIAQVSDIHVGSWGSDTTFVADLTNRINSLKPDMIVFSGDLVNTNSAELKPFVKVLSRLKAPYGVWGILGNHDYGDYYKWDKPADKNRDVETIKNMIRSMNWKLLDNSLDSIIIGSDTLIMAGVGNFDHTGRHNYADLSKTVKGAETKPIVLLSHNPKHWETNEIIRLKPILTLAGHTHAMQLEVFGVSPAQWIYKYWGGMYERDGSYLYVNTGCGETAFPARIGVAPEIALITLHHNEKQ